MVCLADLIRLIFKQDDLKRSDEDHDRYLIREEFFVSEDREDDVEDVFQIFSRKRKGRLIDSTEDNNSS